MSANGHIKAFLYAKAKVEYPSLSHREHAKIVRGWFNLYAVKKTPQTTKTTSVTHANQAVKYQSTL